MQNKILVDFDKTLVTKNSFPLWVKFLLVKSFLGLKFKIFFRIFFLLLKRKVFKNIGHKSFKSSLMRIDYPKSWDDIFSKKIAAHANNKVVGFICESYASGAKIFISSAAPLRYLDFCVREILKQRVDCIDVLGAEIILGRLNDNYKEAKALNLYERGHLEADELLSHVLTDSPDDTPVVLSAKSLILVSDDDDVKLYFRKVCEVNGIGYELMH